MIDLYTWGTPNGRKASIMLEETGLEYQTHQINILEDDQFKPEFLKIERLCSITGREQRSKNILSSPFIRELLPAATNTAAADALWELDTKSVAGLFINP